MKKTLAFVFFGLLVAISSLAAGSSRITLDDGTIIYGKVVGMSNGVYTIQTDVMGEIKVNSDNVSEISSSNKSNSSKGIGIVDGNNRRSNYNYSNSSTGSSAKNSNYTDQQKNVNTKVQSMMLDESFLDSLMELGSSSEMQNVMNDPDVMEAISNGDYEFLMNNPKMNELMNSSGIQDILTGM